MSLYNMLCGVNPAYARILNILGLKHSDIPRFRDVYIEKDFSGIVIRTRTGGGNRPAHQEGNQMLIEHELYEKDWDDDADDTYAYFSFNVPEAEKIKLMQEIKDQVEGNHEAIDRVINVISERPHEKVEKAMKAMEKKK